MDVRAKDKIEILAVAAHMANRAYCAAIGDDSVPLWADAGEEQVLSVREGVSNAIAGWTPEQLHARWMERKLADGWKLGKKKDAVKKTHPCLVPFGELPPERRRQDQVFAETVRALAAVL